MQNNILIILIISIGLILAISLLTKPFKFTYTARKYLLSKSELNFYRALVKSLPKDYTVMCKVRLADIIYSTDKGRERMYGFNKINSKHIDFLILDSSNLAIKLAIELNDRSHSLPNRVLRDEFIANTLKNAGVMFKTVENKYTYSNQEIESIFAALNTKNS